MFESISCLAVYVTDMSKAKEFYTQVLGFKVTADLGDNLCFLRSDKVNVYLEAGHKPSSVDAATARLSFFLEPKSVNETFNMLKAKGVKLLQQAPEQVGDDTWWFQFADPCGNILEVSGKP